MELKLTSEERARLQKLHKKERDKRICDRIKAVLAYADGYTYSEVARLLLLDDETIRRHIEHYLKNNKLAPQNGGSESKLSDKEAHKLIEHLQEITYLYVKDICEYVRDAFGKKFSISGMTKWLHSHKFCHKKPHAVPAKADKRKQKKFIRHYHCLKKKAGKKEPIYFADSVHPQHQTQLAYGWILKGVRKEIATTPYQKRLNFIGCICLNGHRFTESRPAELPRQSLAKRCVNLSTHTASIRQTHPPFQPANVQTTSVLSSKSFLEISPLLSCVCSAACISSSPKQPTSN